MHPSSRIYKVMILHICHKWLQHSHIIEVSFSNGDKCTTLWTLKMVRYTTHAQRSRGKYIIPLPCCDTYIFHLSFMRALNPERDQKKIQTSSDGFYSSFCWLSAICMECKRLNCFKRGILLKHYIS